MLWYYDWIGQYKLADFGGYVFLCGPDADFMPACRNAKEVLGRRPDIRSVYPVSEEFYNEFKDVYAAKGMLFDGEEQGGEL